MNNFKKIIEYGLYLLVFLLPIQTRWIIKPGVLNSGYWEYGTISLYLTDILLIFVLIIFIILKTLKLPITNYQLPNKTPNSKPPISNFWFYIALLDLAIIISIFFAADKSLAVYGYARFLLGVGLFWLIVSAKYDKIKLIWSLIAGAAIQAGLGIWQFLSQASFAFKWLGMAEHKPFDLGTSVVETMGFDGVAERWLRAYGGLDHPNILGGFLAIVSLLLIVMFINSKSTMSLRAPLKRDEAIPAKRTNRDCFTTLAMTAIFFTSYFLLLTSLFFTFSRGAWAGFVAGLIATLAILFWQKNEKAMKRALELIFVGFVIVLFLFNLYSNLVLTRLSKDTRLEIKSNTERLESYKYAKEIIKRHWLFGVGIGNYTLYNANLQSAGWRSESIPPRRDEYANRPSWYYQPVHNTFLLIWAETGLLGLIGFLGLLLCVMCYVLCENKKNEKVSYIVLNFSVLVALTVMMLVDHWWWSLHFGVFLLWTVLGIILKEDNLIKIVK